jgi:hypothetical protein
MIKMKGLAQVLCMINFYPNINKSYLRKKKNNLSNYQIFLIIYKKKILLKLLIKA